MRSPDGGLAARRRGASSRCRDAETAQEHGPSDRGQIRRLHVDSNVRERPVPAQRAAGPAFDLIASKLRPPSVRSDAILRPWLIERLTRDDSRPVVSVVAPPGYGKTTLLAQWAEHSSQAFTWVSVDEEDNRGVKQMDADADEAVQRLTAANIAAPVAGLCQGIARILSGDVEGGDASLEDTASAAEKVGAHEILALALGERSLLAMARGDWGQAEALAGQVGTVLRRAGMENLLACAVQARAALHRGDVPAARQQLVSAQRLRPMVTYAMPQLAVQARIELTRVHLALADVAGARTLMREIDELLKRRPDLGTLVGQAQVLRTQLLDPEAAQAMTGGISCRKGRRPPGRGRDRAARAGSSRRRDRRASRSPPGRHGSNRSPGCGRDGRG